MNDEHTAKSIGKTQMYTFNDSLSLAKEKIQSKTLQTGGVCMCRLNTVYYTLVFIWTNIRTLSHILSVISLKPFPFKQRVNLRVCEFLI